MAGSNALEPEICTCGKPEGTFACKIRHIQLNTGDAKAASDAPAKRKMRGIEVH